MGEIDWVLVLTFAAGMAGGGLSVAAAVLRCRPITPANSQLPDPQPVVAAHQETPAKVTPLASRPKYNPLTRKIDHRN